MAPLFDTLVTELRDASDGRAAAEVLQRATAQDGPLGQLQNLIEAAAKRTRRLPQPLAAELTGPLVDAVTDISTHLADDSRAAPTLTNRALADAARTTSRNQKTPDDRTGATSIAKFVPHQASATNRRR